MASEVTSQLRVNLVVKTPVLLGLRARIAMFFCNIAAFILGGKLKVEAEVEVE